MSKSRRILGVDPGTNFLGYAVVDVKKNKFLLVKIGVVKMKHLESQQLKLKKIFERLQEIILSVKPEEMAIEAPFFGKNVQSMLKLGRAQGVAIAAGITNDVNVTEYSPKKIKQSVTGKQVLSVIFTRCDGCVGSCGVSSFSNFRSIERRQKI